MAEHRKTGRPTDNPKTAPIHVRLDAESEKILKLYCQQKGVSKMEAARRGIKRLKDELE